MRGALVFLLLLLLSYVTASVFHRTVFARYWQNGQYTSKRNASQVGASLASTRPTYVSGLIRWQDMSTPVPDRVLAEFMLIRAAVLQASPQCLFDWEVDARKEHSPQSATEHMDYIYGLQKAGKMRIDAIFSDFWSKADRNVTDTVVAYCKRVGWMVGGNIMGSRPIPPGTQMAGFHDKYNRDTGNFDIPWDTMRGYLGTSNAEFLVHVNNGPNTDACSYVGVKNPNGKGTPKTWEQRVQINTVLAAGQSQRSDVRYKYMYPVLFPQCPTNVAHDAALDKHHNTTLLAELIKLMNKYN